MRLDVLGSSGTAPTLGNPASGYLVRTDHATLWMDAGPGTYMALLALVDPEQVDAVLLSHMHADHCTDLFALFHGLKYAREVTTALPVVAPDGSIERLRGFTQAGPDHALFEALAIHEAGPGERLLFGDITVTAQAAHHSVPALGYRLEAGEGSLAYTGDTGPSQMIVDHFRGAHTVMAEASLRPGDDYPFHMTGRQAGELAAAAGAQRLILTHIPETVDAEESRVEAAHVFPGEISLAQPGDVYMI